MDIVNIEALIAQKRVVLTADIDPANDYAIIGKYQAGTSKSRGDGTSYKSYVIPLSELLGGGTTYTGSNGITLVGNDFQFTTHNISQFTNNSGYITAASLPAITNKIIPIGNGTSIVDSTWSVSVTDLLPMTYGSNIGDDTHRIGTIFMASVLNYATDLKWITGVTQTMLLDTNGNVAISAASATARLEVNGVDQTINNFVAKFNDSLGTPLMHINDAGFVGIGSTSTTSKLSVNIGNAAGTDLILDLLGTIPFVVNNRSVMSVNNNGRLVLGYPNSGLGGTVGHTFAAPLNATNALNVQTSGLVQGLFFIETDGSFRIGHLATSTTQFAHDGISKFTFTGDVPQFVGIGELVPTSTLHIKGADTSSTAYSLKIDNSSSIPLLYVKNSGGVSMPNLPTSAAGLVAGDLWNNVGIVTIV